MLIKNNIFYIKLVNLIFEHLRTDNSFFTSFITSETNHVSTVEEYSSSESGTLGIEKIPSSQIILRDPVYGDLVCSDNDFKSIKIFYSQKCSPDKTILLSAVYSRLSFENVLLCHASLIDYRGHGILFVGPSGIGKTTQAELWNKYRNADIINGDKAFIKVEENEVRGYGLPWKGSSPYCLNADVKLDGVVVLRQAKENKIRELSFEEKLQLFVPHIFLPVWDENCMSAAMNTLDMLIPQIPVYLLECRPDEAAVELTEKTVLKNI